MHAVEKCRAEYADMIIADVRTPEMDYLLPYSCGPKRVLVSLPRHFVWKLNDVLSDLCELSCFPDVV